MRTVSAVPRPIRSLLLAFLLILSMFVPEQSAVTPIASAQGGAATTGEWLPVNNWGIFGKHMVLMPNGKVLAWPTGQDAFVWDPVTNIKTAVPALFGDLHCAAQVTLADGRVLVAGGVIESPHDGISVTAIFDPNTNLWSQATPMHYARWYGTATTLGDGRVLLSSGDINSAQVAMLPEVYDPTTDAWTVYPNASRDLGLYPHMFVLPDGKAYAAGTKKNTYLLDVNNINATWVAGPINSFGSSGYAESSAMYAPGKIIRSGGDGKRLDGTSGTITSTAIVDMSATGDKLWHLTSPMHFPRRRHNMVVLADGEVMAVGGTEVADDPLAAVYQGEIWNPDTGQWTLTSAMTYDRMYHSAALLLPDGSVLTAGGENGGRLNSQIFKPPYLFKGPRPQITAAPSVVGYGTAFNVTTNVSNITGVALIRPSAVTHAFDHNQRYVPLTFTPSGNTLAVSAPANGNIAPPGYYMLVVKDSNGVPSVASWVRVDSSANLQPGTVSGKVTDGSNNPIVGATVSYNGANPATTDSNGDYTLTGVLPGEHVFTASKSASNFADVSKSQVVVGGATTTLNFTLKPPGTITGKITNSENSNPIAGAIITHSSGTATSNASGDYTIADIPSGPQTLIASAPGYNSSPEQIVNVPANGTVTHNIALTPKPSYIAGEIRDKVTQETLAGAVVSNGTAMTTTDSFGRYQLFTPPGTYTLTVSLNGYATLTHPDVLVTFGTYTAVDLELDTINAPVTLTPVADAYVDPATPSSNYGSEVKLRLDTSPALNSYLRFTVTGLTRPVQSAKLRLYVTDASPLAGQLYAVSNTYNISTTAWTETGIKWNNAPSIGGIPLSAPLGAAINTWAEFDVSTVITGNGIVSFGLKGASTNLVEYSSKEGANPPQLVIQQDPPPSISGFTPSSGLVGTQVTISGANFVGITGVTFNNAAAGSFTVDSPTQIRAAVPNSATSGKIRVISGGGTATSANDFTVIPPPPPSISGFTPTSGPVGTMVTINGANFGGVTSVRFNGVAATNVAVDSPIQIRAAVPNGATSGKISVTTTGGAASSATNFIVTASAPPPTISSFTPASGPVGTEVTINGANFVGVTGVRFHGVAASSFTIDSATRIRAVVPNSATSGKIGVTTVSGAASSATNFAVTSTSPQQNQRVYLPLVRNGAAASASDAPAQYDALSWDESETLINICLLDKR